VQRIKKRLIGLTTIKRILINLRKVSETSKRRANSKDKVGGKANNFIKP
jgi:hypothetical protein